MTTVALYGGPLKRDLIQTAYEECGQASYEFDLTPEEYAAALRRMNNMLSEWQAAYGIDLGYNFPDNGTDGNAEDESGIPPGAAQVVSGMLALRVAPAIGKTLSAETRAMLSRSWEVLRTSYACTPSMEFGRNTLKGAGHRRWWSRRNPFFPVRETCQKCGGYPIQSRCGCSAEQGDNS